MKLFSILASIFLLSGNALAVSCHGTEPFWGAEVTKDKIVLNMVGFEADAPKTLAVSSVSGAAGYTASFLKVYSNQGKKVAVMTSNKCDNGMSDHIFPNQIIIFNGAETLYGCCGEGVVDGPGI